MRSLRVRVDLYREENPGVVPVHVVSRVRDDSEDLVGEPISPRPPTPMGMSNARGIRGPGDVDEEIRDAMCGAVARHVLAAAGESCNRRSVDEIVDELDALRHVHVDRWEPAEDQADNRDFVDLTLEDDADAGRMFLILTRNGFVPESFVFNMPEDGAVFQWKR